MPWLIGIDEAGYGPNLGPLIQASAPIFVPEAETPVWEVLAAAVRRANDKDDGRLLVDDSKRVYEGVHGFAKLERGVLAAFSRDTVLPFSIGDFLKTTVSEECRSELLREPWYDVTVILPQDAGLETVLELGTAFHRCLSNNKLRMGPIRSVVTPTPRFNDLLDKWGTKSAVLADGVIALLQANRALPGKEPLVYLIDKLGGRNFYAAMISTAFSDGWVVAEREGPEICSYRITGVEREIRLVFQPRADGAHFTVALASMVSKYIREICMRQFNRWWQTQVPHLKPTAGYPVDARRFMAQIRDKSEALGFEERAIWRRK